MPAAQAQSGIGIRHPGIGKAQPCAALVVAQAPVGHARQRGMGQQQLRRRESARIGAGVPGSAAKEGDLDPGLDAVDIGPAGDVPPFGPELGMGTMVGREAQPPPGQHSGKGAPGGRAGAAGRPGVGDRRQRGDRRCPRSGQARRLRPEKGAASRRTSGAANCRASDTAPSSPPASQRRRCRLTSPPAPPAPATRRRPSVRPAPRPRFPARSARRRSRPAPGPASASPWSSGRTGD